MNTQISQKGEFDTQFRQLKNKGSPKYSYLYFQFHGAFPLSLNLPGQTYKREISFSHFLL
ncbi:hypothetical protein ASZ90_005641 [hydrocarbon metagenome]|uniref:Uncharacterized protein n=1 Tax=hydrocarbon metagenome TaxID=938273 RepID=A0A0W8FUN5_9ZZZZ